MIQLSEITVRLPLSNRRVSFTRIRRPIQENAMLVTGLLPPIFTNAQNISVVVVVVRLAVATWAFRWHFHNISTVQEDDIPNRTYSSDE